MSEIQVEVCFTDKLESVRVGGKKMEIPKAVKAKPVEEWFEPAAGRVKWGGLGAEIKEMDFGGEKDAALWLEPFPSIKAIGSPNPSSA